jgi:hypothetical protein
MGAFITLQQSQGDIEIFYTVILSVAELPAQQTKISCAKKSKN